MVKIRLEILGTNLPYEKERLEYKIRTWWTKISISHLHAFQRPIDLVSPPLFIERCDQHQKLHKKTPIFIEVWHKCDSSVTPVPDEDDKPKEMFLGLVKANIDEQIMSLKMNSVVKWLKVYDPIEGFVRGKLLLKIELGITNSETLLRELKPNPSTVKKTEGNYESDLLQLSQALTLKTTDDQISAPTLPTIAITTKPHENDLAKAKADVHDDVRSSKVVQTELSCIETTSEVPKFIENTVTVTEAENSDNDCANNFKKQIGLSMSSTGKNDYIIENDLEKLMKKLQDVENKNWVRTRETATVENLEAQSLGMINRGNFSFDPIVAKSNADRSSDEDIVDLLNDKSAKEVVEEFFSRQGIIQTCESNKAMQFPLSPSSKESSTYCIPDSSRSSEREHSIHLSTAKEIALSLDFTLPAPPKHFEDVNNKSKMFPNSPRERCGDVIPSKRIAANIFNNVVMP